MYAIDRRLSVAYIGPKSGTERPRKTIIAMEVAHVTPVTRTPLSRSKGQGHVVNIVPTRKMCHIVVADKPTLFECHRLTECVHFLVTDCKFPQVGVTNMAIGLYVYRAANVCQ